MNTVVLIPIFNEANNLQPLVNAIFRSHPDCTVAFIDDNSTDNSDAIIKELSKLFKIQHHVRKNERGFGSAIRYGFQLLRDADIVITMDGDRSHDPITMPVMINAIIEKGYDIVIGSRYIKGGSVENWPLFRRITSAMTNNVVRFFLGTGINDNSGGYRAYSGKAIRSLSDKIQSEGYNIQEEILFVASNIGLRILEVPIVFSDRKEGTSKAKFIKEAVGLIRMIIRLRSWPIKTI